MRVVLFDSILERHLAESLERAFLQLGDQVYSTGLIHLGHKFVEDEATKLKIWSFIETALEFQPDLFISFRPMNLLPDMLKHIRKSCVTAVWLSDDPVLYKLCYGQVASHYDILLHCGSENIIEFYHSNGHCHGVNFPFWTDNISFPYAYSPLTAVKDLVFLGNMNGVVRRKRYREFAELPFSKSIYGSVDSDYAAIHGGVIKKAYENSRLVSHVLSRHKAAVSIPQFFSTYKGSEYYFQGLDRLGYFQYPSRVIQYIASGLPVGAIGDDLMKDTMPEISVANSLGELSGFFSAITEDLDYSVEQSRKVYKRFLSSYSASSRASFLHYLLKSGDEAFSLSIADKSRLFFQTSSSVC